jgi:hypothetical protein
VNTDERDADTIILNPSRVIHPIPDALNPDVPAPEPDDDGIPLILWRVLRTENPSWSPALAADITEAFFEPRWLTEPPPEPEPLPETAFDVYDGDEPEWGRDNDVTEAVQHYQDTYALAAIRPRRWWQWRS